MGTASFPLSRDAVEDLELGSWRWGGGRGGVLRLVSWCFKPSQPQRIISGLRETHREIRVVERTSEAEMRPEEQSEKAKGCPENL